MTSLQCLDECSGALATEVRTLLGEVRRIHEQKRVLEQCDYPPQFISFIG